MCPQTASTALSGLAKILQLRRQEAANGTRSKGPQWVDWSKDSVAVTVLEASVRDGASNLDATQVAQVRPLIPLPLLLPRYLSFVQVRLWGLGVLGLGCLAVAQQEALYPCVHWLEHLQGAKHGVAIMCGPLGGAVGIASHVGTARDASQVL